MARDRDVAAFGERAQGYDEGWRGELHHQIADRTAELALTCVPAPRRILDVGCGTGYLLGRLAARAPQAEALAGIDAAAAMIAVATGAATDSWLRFVVGAAERAEQPDQALRQSQLPGGLRHAYRRFALTLRSRSVTAARTSASAAGIGQW